MTFYISPHLATSRHISQVHMTFSGGFEEEWAEGEARESKLVFIGRLGLGLGLVLVLVLRLS